MATLDHLRRMLTYDAWANEDALGSLRRTTPCPPRSLRWLAHIIAAEHLWLDRLTGTESTMPVWPDLSLSECAEQLGALTERWRPLAAALTEEALGTSVAYTNSKGERFTSDTGDILTHVVIHSAYHRGQIASDVRTSGGTPAYTDYIHAVRQGFVP